MGECNQLFFTILWCFVTQQLVNPLLVGGRKGGHAIAISKQDRASLIIKTLEQR